MNELKMPLTEEVVRSLTLGESVSLSGIIVTARDAAHKYLVEERPDFIRPYLEGGAIYHCGPVIREGVITSAGPTTSIREEGYEADVIREYGIRAVIGKGGMGPRTAEALSDAGCVYLHAVGGAGTLAARRIVCIKDVFCEAEFGSPEAFWVLEVKEFPAVVTMDAKGNSLHREIEEESRKRFRTIL